MSRSDDAIKRYDLVYSQFFYGPGIGEKSGGTYCMYDDHKAREAELLAEIVELRNKAVFIETEYKLDIANMKARHAAMIAELRGLAEFDTGAHEYYPIYAENMLDVLDKYEVLK